MFSFLALYWTCSSAALFGAVIVVCSKLNQIRPPLGITVITVNVTYLREYQQPMNERRFLIGRRKQKFPRVSVIQKFHVRR